MKKRNGTVVGMVLLFLGFCLLFAQPVQAAQQEVLLEQSGAADLTENVDGSVQAELESYGISMDEPESIQKFGIGTVFTMIKKGIWLLNVFLGVPFTIPSYEYLAALDILLCDL